MNLKTTLFIFAYFLSLHFAAAQDICTTPGQTPGTAFPVCATSVFEQKEVPICGSTSLFVPGCSELGNANYQNKNPYWYKFTCFESGTLGFTIKPKDQSDDYDWQLYDITGLSPDAVFTNRNIIITGNWAGNPGNTGTASNGAPYIQCASPYDGNEPRFARMPNLVEGHEYLLLVSHFSNTQSGYDLSFSGGTAVITAPQKPELLSLNYSCDATTIFIKTNKRVKCSSVADDGSDFHIPFSGANVISAKPVCSGFDTDSIELKLDLPLPAGLYNVVIKEGTDGNTLLDNCDNYVPEGDKLDLEIAPLSPTPMDSLLPVQCAPDELSLIFSKKIQCASVAPDGSDFMITGPFPVAISGLIMDCNQDNLTDRITLKLQQPIVNDGTFRIVLLSGADGNSIIDECGLETPAGAEITFSVKDTVNADFTFDIVDGCKEARINFFHHGLNSVNKWNWKLDYSGTSHVQNPEAVLPPYGDKTIDLFVTNGFCSDSASAIISLGEELKADFEITNIMCPEDSLQILNRSTGEIASYWWMFGDGTNSIDSLPAEKRFPFRMTDETYPVMLVITDDAGCTDTAVSSVRVLLTCRIDVPTAFTPNGDNLNDYLYPLNAIMADSLIFRVYNRLGQMVFETRDWQNKWDGRFKGDPQNTGVYAWTLEYIERNTGKYVFRKGSTTLIR